MNDDFGVPKRTAYAFFVNHPEGSAIERVREPAWPALETVFISHAIARPIAFLPPELHLDTLVLHAARRCQIPATSGSVFDLPWTVAAIKMSRADCIISTAAVLPFLLQALSANDHLHTITNVITIGEPAPTLELETVKRHCLSHPFLDYVSDV